MFSSRTFFILLSILFGILSVVAVGSILRQPRIVAEGISSERDNYELGEILQNETLEGNLTFWNRHTKPISIIETMASCSCTATLPSEKVVLPGKPFTVNYRWAVGLGRGKLSQSLRLLYDVDGARNTVEVLLSCVVNPDISFEPAYLTFDSNRAETKNISFSAGAESEFQIESPEANQRAFRAELHGTILTVSFEPSKWVDSDSGEAVLSLRTSSKREPILRIPLTVQRPVPMVMPSGK